ncbi:GAF domain-containing protein [Acidisphaera sp. L21]|uniref:GAF domain-containing protein n=1 Tax=Acidisphaera sp. L21 TaxID=1641851 RepID=UPI001C20C089|nr:GAF domain-containing protein [Acidisphaera sp. L21]
MESFSEAKRLQRLRDTGILDTMGDQLFRGFAEQALDVMPGTSIAAVSLVDSDRQWFKTIIGLTVKQLPREVSFCSHTIQSDGTMVVEDATRDSRFARNPLVISHPGIRFYAGVNLMQGLGALCVIGQQPRRATSTEITKLTKLAHYVEIQLLAHGVLFNLDAAAIRPSLSPSRQ